MKIFSTLTILITSFVLTCLFFSCTQKEGIGGNSHIKGKIMANYYNEDFSILLYDQPEPAKDEDVYLVFGNDSVVGIDTKTSFLGDFEFEYLWPGKYKLYYYSEDKTGQSSELVEIVKEFTLGKNETLEFNDLILSKHLKWDEGSSYIKGKIMINYYSDEDSLLSDEPLPAKDEDVFLIFKDNPVFKDDTKTNYSGDFAFNYLWPGNYKIYCYSEDTSGISPENIEVVKDITLGKNETVKLDTLFINKILKWNEGTSSFKGTVYLTNYKTTGEFKDRTPAQEHEIYLTYGSHPFYDERIRTSADGTFMFRNLIKGKYHIFLYSEDLEGGTANKVIERDFEITEDHQDIVLEEIIEIYQL
jgi:hypothetical protein